MRPRLRATALSRALTVAVFVLTAFLPPSAHADMFQPSHGCYEPIKPYRFSSQLDIDMFKDEVDTYRRCIQDFIDEQQEAIRRHSEAAQDALDDWNRFVDLQLH